MQVSSHKPNEGCVRIVFEKGTVVVMIENVYYILTLSLVVYSWSFSCGYVQKLFCCCFFKL